MNWLLFLGLFLVSGTPLFAQAQPDPAKVKADAQKVVSVIKGDKAKTQAYCEINDLGEQIGEANQKEDHEKAEALSQQVTELEKKLGPEYIALVNDLNNVEARDAFLRKCMEDRGRSARPGACRSRQRAQAIEKPPANREQRIRIKRAITCACAPVAATSRDCLGRVQAWCRSKRNMN